MGTVNNVPFLDGTEEMTSNVFDRPVTSSVLTLTSEQLANVTPTKMQLRFLVDLDENVAGKKNFLRIIGIFLRKLP